MCPNRFVLLLGLRIVCCGFFLSAGLAHADVFAPIDVRKRADVNGQNVAMPVLNFNSIPQQTLPQPVSPLTGKRSERGKTVETKTLDNQVLQFSTVGTKIVPQSNFESKRASINQTRIDTQRIETGNVATPRAVINERVIRPMSPTGAQELKEQFRKTP